MRTLLAAVAVLAASLAVLPAEASGDPPSPCISGIAGWQCSVRAADCRAAIGYHTPSDLLYAFVSCQASSPLGACYAYADSRVDRDIDC